MRNIFGVAMLPTTLAAKKKPKLKSPTNYQQKGGYDPDFLGKNYSIPHPTVPDTNDVVPVDGNPKNILNYTHFSVVMSKQRKFAIYTACNIDGKQSRNIPRDSNQWYFDPRINQKYQFGNPLYAKNDLDRGHLVRRLDPVWGSKAVASVANDDTFHFTNCSPQHKGFNQSLWLSLEEYILDNADVHNLKVNVFTGPVFEEDDRDYRGAKLPKQYWKVIVIVRKNKQLSATAYVVSQADLITTLEFVYGKFRTYQITIRRVEQMTGLKFGDLNTHDPFDSFEASGLAVMRPLKSLEDIVV